MAFYRAREVNGMMLSIRDQAGAMILTWPIPAESRVLHATTNLFAPPGFWTKVPPPDSTQGSANVLLIEPSPSGHKFYRLHKPRDPHGCVSGQPWHAGSLGPHGFSAACSVNNLRAEMRK